MLDVCCYTGGFGLHALVRGGAREVTCVDLDEKAIALARDNANANQVRPTLVHADAFGYMRQMARNGRSFGVVVLDPPKLIPGRLDVAAGKRKYFDLNVLAMSLVEPGGVLLTCSCSGLLPPEEFLFLLRAAARKAGRSAQVLAVDRRRAPTTRSASMPSKGPTSRPSGSAWANRPAHPDTGNRRGPHGGAGAGGLEALFERRRWNTHIRSAWASSCIAGSASRDCRKHGFVPFSGNSDPRESGVRIACPDAHRIIPLHGSWPHPKG